MGWCPPERSMIESLRNPSPSGPSMKNPSSSGPRWVMVLVIASMFGRWIPEVILSADAAHEKPLVYSLGLLELKGIDGTVACLLCFPGKQKSETAKQLRLRPAM